MQRMEKRGKNKITAELMSVGTMVLSVANSLTADHF